MHGPNIVVDVRDILTELLRCWKRVVALMLLFAVLVIAGSAAITWSQVQAEKALQESTLEAEEERAANLELAKSVLTTKEREEVETLLGQMNTYTAYRKMWQDEFSGYMEVVDDEGGNQLVKRSAYKFSTTIEGADNILTSLAMGADDYRKVMEILPGANTLSAAYKYVTIWTVANEASSTNFVEETSENEPKDFLINVEVVGDTRSICDEASEIIDAAFNREVKKLQKIDSETNLSFIDSQYLGNIKSYIARKQQTTFEMMQKMDSAISAVRTNYVDKMSRNQLNYYNLLKDEEKGITVVAVVDEEEDSLLALEGTKPDYVSSRSILLGLIVGLLLSCICNTIAYLMSGKVKSASELEVGYGISVLNTFFDRNSGSGPFKGLIRRMHHADTFTQESIAAMVAADVCGTLSKEEDSAVYLVETCDNQEDSKIMDAIRVAIRNHPEGGDAAIGKPLQNPEDVWEMTQKKNSLLVVHARRTTLGDLEKILDLCRRHAVNVLGAVVITDL